jgi:hypothetical protein
MDIEVGLESDRRSGCSHSRMILRPEAEAEVATL